jgi:hypothetical protein
MAFCGMLHYLDLLSPLTTAAMSHPFRMECIPDLADRRVHAGFAGPALAGHLQSQVSDVIFLQGLKVARENRRPLGA